jgi:hypothetical protein
MTTNKEKKKKKKKSSMVVSMLFSILRTCFLALITFPIALRFARFRGFSFAVGDYESNRE